MCEWTPEHFIGGHPDLDLANAVFNRRTPAADNELLQTARDIGNWLKASGVAGKRGSSTVAAIPDQQFVDTIHMVREASAQLLGSIAAHTTPPAGALSFLFATAAGGLAGDGIKLDGCRPRPTPARWRDPATVAAVLATLSIDGFFTLPRERVRRCPRCGWLFVDASRGGKRRWCSMQVCGNREKVSRHRNHS